MRLRKQALGTRNLVGARVEMARKSQGMKQKELLAQLQEIEREMGRRHKSHDGIYSDRVIDLDILIYDQRVVTTPELTIPHPRMCERAFVLQPLSYIAPELTIPTTGTTVDQLLGAQPA